MEVSEDTLSSDDSKFNDSKSGLKRKHKKRSIIERELETSLTPQFISPVSSDGQTTSRYGRARRVKTDTDFCDTEKAVTSALKSPQMQAKTPVKPQSPSYKMHALNSPVHTEANHTSDLKSVGNNIDDQIENICNANLSFSRFGPENKKASPSLAKKCYTRKDMIQSKEKDDPILLIKNMFSPASDKKTSTNTVKSSEKKTNNFSKQNGHISTPSVVKTLDFDSKKKKKDGESKVVMSKSDLFELEAKCGFQVGDVVWARMGTFPFWPCIINREPGSDMFVKKKLFGRIERNMIHVTFFGDNGRRSWILDSMLRKFQGKTEFETAREQFTPEAKKKDPRLYAAFFVSEKKQALWNFSVDEAETLFKEPKRLRIDLLYEMLEKSRISKHTPKGQKSGKIARTDSDVSLSESLYDSLFSEDDIKSDDTDKKTKLKRKSLDVSEVVTACLDNMAAKTGMTVIQKQSHMDRWLQKAKSKTPEKLQVKVPVTVENIETDKKEVVLEKVKETKNDCKKKSKDLTITKKVPAKKPYSLRRSTGESQILLFHNNEHDYSKLDVNIKVPGVLDVAPNNVCVIEKGETVSNDQDNKAYFLKTQTDDGITEVTKEIIPDQVKNVDDDKIKENIELNSLLTEDNNKMDLNGSILDNLQSNDLQTADKIKINHDNSNITESCCQTTNRNEENKNLQPNTLKNNDIILNDDSNIDSIEKNELKLTESIPNDVTELDIAVELNVAGLKDNHIKENDNHIEESNMYIDNTEPTEDSIKNNQTDKILTKETLKNDDKRIVNSNLDEDNARNNEDVISNSESEFELLYDVSPIKEKEDKSLEAGKINGTTLNMEIENNLNDNSNSIENDKAEITKIIEDKIEKEDVTVRNADEMSTLKKNGDELTKIKDVDLDTLKVFENYCKELRICLTPLKNNVVNGHLSKAPKPRESSNMQPYVNGFEDLIESKARKTEINSHEDTKAIGKDVSNNIKIIGNSKMVRSITPTDTCTENAAEIGTSTNLPETEENINENGIDDKSKNSFGENNHVKVLDNLSKETNIIVGDSIEEVHLPITVNKVDSNNQNNDEFTDLDLTATDEMLKAMKTIEGLMTEFDSETTSITSGITEVSSPIKMPVDILNDLRESDALKRIKHDLFLDSDTESASSELDNVNLKDLKATLSKNNKASNENDSKRNNNKAVNDSADVSEAESGSKTEKNHRKRSLRLRPSQSPTDSIKVNGFIDSKESSPDRKIKNEIDPDTISINSEDSTASCTRRRGRKEKQKEKEDRSKDPEFLRYLEMRQDNLIDEHPELTLDEIVAYLYKTWLYEENLKPDIKKSDDLDQMTLVKGVNEQLQPKRAKKKIKSERKKLIDIDKVLDKDLIIDLDALPRDTPKRKSVQSCYYKEDFSDIEDEIQLFEIFKKKPAQNQEKAESSKTVSETIKSPKAVTSDTVIVKTEDLIPEEEYYADEEKYFEEMTKPKPNLFKGLVREKVCEICEKTSNLVKCKGCNDMFHVDCANKEPEVVEVSGPTRGRKKKKKPRGRKPKSMDGLDESHSDEKSREIDENDINNSVDEIKEPERIIADANNFEAQMEAKMKELLDKPEYIDLDSYSSDDGIDWTDTVAGKCEIVDVILKPKHIESSDHADFKCMNCQKNEIPICFVCKSTVSPKSQNSLRQRCQVAHCCKYYHVECLDHWPQTQFNAGDLKTNKKDGSIEPLTCPRHVCHTCVSDDPRGCKTRFSGDKLARCVRCPATYHTFTKCLPAGSQILTASHIICPRHYQHRPGKVPCHVNTAWCFLCALGGVLICCEYCPMSFHAECLDMELPDGGYMCEDCETGRLPLYGEMVWVKLGHYRWWPGIILHPSEIPSNILAIKHSLGEFVVRFFGQYDHYWVNRGRVFPFQEGDSGKISSQKSKIDEAFTKAIEHSQRAFEILKNTEQNQEESLDIASSLLPPHYVKLKVNKPSGSVIGRKVEYEESSLTQCECRPEEEDPCGPHSHCLNRMLLTECGPNCRTGDRCNNRAFEKRLYPKMVPYRTPHRGWGLKTLVDIKAGQFVIEYVGELIDDEEFRRRMRRKHEIRDEDYYFLVLDKERMIDAGPKGNLARFMNHCCEPNCETQKWTVLGDIRVGLFASKDIPANTEVTFNYNYNPKCEGIEKKQCLCGAKRCSGYIGAKPKQDEPQAEKTKITVKRTYKKRKNIENSPSTSNKIKRPVGRPAKPRELTEIEKDLLIIKNATNGLSSDSEGSGRLSSIDDPEKNKSVKRKRELSSDEAIPSTSNVKKIKIDEENLEVVSKSVVDS